VRRRAPIAFPLVAAALGGVALAAPDAGFPPSVRGIVVSTHGAGQDWGDDAMIPTLGELKQLGAGWVAIHPYAEIGADGSVRPWRFGDGEPPAHLVRPIEIAHALDMKILITPHLAHWGSPFGWRGEIAFERPEHWRRFWADYERWIVWLAGVTRAADGFVVGSELDRTLDHATHWRGLIAAVRASTPAPLTYAANWSDFERVTFWDALDAIGIQAYFPLADRPAASESAIRDGWEAWMRRLAGYSARHARPILFVELGYNRSLEAAVRPWDPRSDDGPEAAAQQELCLRVALGAIEREPSVLGAFLWKWFPQPRPAGRNFQLATPAMRRAIREAWDRPPVAGPRLP
jgi:hypothetical protein